MLNIVPPAVLFSKSPLRMRSACALRAVHRASKTATPSRVLASAAKFLRAAALNEGLFISYSFRFEYAALAFLTSSMLHDQVVWNATKRYLHDSCQLPANRRFFLKISGN